MAQVITDNLESEVRALVANILEIDEKKISPSGRFVEELGMDSMMALEIMASLEKKYKIKISEEYLTKVTDLKSIVNITRKILGEK
jgi:acyl carrier protein